MPAQQSYLSNCIVVQIKPTHVFCVLISLVLKSTFTVDCQIYFLFNRDSIYWNKIVSLSYQGLC